MKIKLIEMRFRLKFVTLFFLFISNFVFAQNTLDNVGLTSATPASVVYSLRQLSTTYTGPLVRVKVGASFYDVYPDASTKKFTLSSKISTSISTYNAAVSVASGNALNSIISGSTDATVAIWYDQSGNGVHVLSSSATAKIITAGSIVTMNGQPTIKFSSTDSFLSSTSTVNYSSQSGATVNAIAQNEATTSFFGGIVGTADAGGYPGYNITYSSREGYESDGHGCEYGSGVITTDPKMITNIFINSSTNLSKIYVNSILKTNTAVTANTCSLFNVSGSIIYIGAARGNSGLTFNGNISEAVIFPKQLIDGERNPLESNQSATYFSPTVTITSSASGAVCAGTSVTFTAVASNISSPTYQWTKNGIGIPGANSSTYSSTTLSNNDVIKVWVNAGINNSAIVSNGLLLNLDASNPGSYSGTGNNWYDLSGNNNHATLRNSPTFDVASGSVVTNGTNQYITIPNLNTSNSNITMQAWIYFDGSTRPGALIGAKNGYSIGKGDNAYDVSGNNLVLLLYGAAGGWKSTGQSYGTSGWKLVTMTLDGSSTARAYIDGTLKYTYSGAAPSAPLGDLNLGAIPEDGYRYYDGKFAAAYFYNRALSLAEIQQNYDAFATKSTGYGSNTITVAVTGAPPALTVTGDGCASKTTLSTTSGLTSYAWYKDNAAVSGATSNVYTPTAAGVYKVEVTTGSCSSTSTTTSIYTCGRTADGRMSILETSTTLVSKDGALNNGKGVDSRGAILSKPWVYGTVTTRTGRIWMDRNLGATRVAQNSTDVQAYGDYYQWGRPADGHEKHNVSGSASDFTNVKSATSVPGNSKYIFSSDGSSDWLATPDNTLWNGVNAPNNPCPAGFRIPTESEWAAEAAVFTSNNVNGSFETGYGLRLTVGGMATSQKYITAIGNYGQYMTQTAYDNGRVKYFGVISWATWFDTNYNKTTGQSCRCIKD
jgi:uncharacterized protein (TIGR02145 family)